MDPTSRKSKAKRQEAADRELAAIIMRRSKKKIHEMHPLDEINLVPYLDVMVNLIIFILVTISAFMPLGILSIFPPASASDQSTKDATPPPELTLTVAITAQGFTIAGIGGVLPPIPLRADGKYDYDALTQKAVEIKDRYPGERKVVITADQEVKYEVLIKSMDALRNKGERILFDSVKLSAGLV